MCFLINALILINCSSTVPVISSLAVVCWRTVTNVRTTGSCPSGNIFPTNKLDRVKRFFFIDFNGGWQTAYRYVTATFWTKWNTSVKEPVFTFTSGPTKVQTVGGPLSQTRRPLMLLNWNDPNSNTDSNRLNQRLVYCVSCSPAGDC